MASYNSSQLEKMQQEAFNRVNEMHRRSQAIVNSQPPPVQSTVTEQPTPQPQQSPTQSEQVKSSEKAQQNPLNALFSQSEGLRGLSQMWDFKIDEEKALIGIIIYILAKNNADPKLLIGLGYLLL